MQLQERSHYRDWRRGAVLGPLKERKSPRPTEREEKSQAHWRRRVIPCPLEAWYFMQQLCYNVIGEILAALNEQIMLRLTSDTLFLKTIICCQATVNKTCSLLFIQCIKLIVGKYSEYLPLPRRLRFHPCLISRIMQKLQNQWGMGKGRTP